MTKVSAAVVDGVILFRFPVMDGMREWAIEETGATFVEDVELPATLAKSGAPKFLKNVVARARGWAYELPATRENAAIVALTSPLPIDGSFDFNTLAGSVDDDFLMNYVDAMPDDLPQPEIRVHDQWRHQLRGHHFLRRHKGRAMLSMGMGTGKSKVLIDYTINEPDIRTELILCPPSVLGVWRREFRYHCPDANILILDDSYKSVAEKRKAASRFYETAAKSDRGKLWAIAINYESARMKDFAAWASRVLWDMVAADESHRAKDSDGVTGKFLSAMRRVAARRACLTGTPMPHSPGDLHAQFRFIDPSILGDSKFMFTKRYAVTGYFGEAVGWRHKLELRRKFHSKAYVVGSEVLDLPPVVHVEREFDLPPKSLKIYRDLWQEFIAETSRGVVTVDNALVKLIRAQQITSGFVPLDPEIDPWDDAQPGRKVHKPEPEIEILANVKADLAREILADVSEPIVFICRWKYDLEAIRLLVEELEWERNGVKPGNVEKKQKMLDAGVWTHFRYGEISGRTRQESEWKHLHSLNSDAKLNPDFEVYGVNLQSGGVGVDFTRSALVVLYSINFSLGDYEQVLKRFDRPGQTRSTRFYHLIARRTVDRKIYKTLAARKQVVETIIEDVKAGLLDNLESDE